ncbi:gamma-tubulin complex component 5 [Schistocerca piceifrons]|uniref:gamma-tubulin complex component 5 n=1 Tax=Schistocerca piceifrons TaxID=274613 RepID=UPI001F5EE408|nr:gamma-tubulin complex component 5 [Schistocerca piceifrons]
MSHKEELAQDVRKLVKQLTGFEDDDENLRQCESYALSNILYHRCVSVEGQKVRKAMDGIVTKFFVHGHLQASKRLSELFEKFLTDEKFEDPSHCDERWSMLWLLLCLANRPTNKIQPNETPEPVKEKNGDENFDWGAYLMDGVAPFSRPYKDDSDDSFSELDDSGVSSVDEAFTHTSTLSVGHKSAELECTSRNEELVELVNKGVEAERWLKRNVQNCWWITGNVPNEVHSKYPCANFAESWEEYSVAERNDGHCCKPRTIKISEYKVVREVLFMLHSPSATFLFYQENGRFVVRNDVTIPSLTKDAVKNYLGHVCEYVNIVYELQKFREEVYAGYQSDNTSATRLPTFTFEAYAASVHDILQEFAQFISKIEGRVRKQEDINTLYQLMCELRPKFKELKVVYDTHVLAIEDWKESPKWLAVTRLLSVLYEAGISATEVYESRHILKLFLKSFRPYFGIISTWLTEGHLEDWRQEFIITRNDNVIDRTWEMWEEGFTLHPYINCLKSKGIEPLPLLEDVAEKVLHAGKSIELLKKLNKIGDFSHLSDMKGSLYKEFLIAIIKELPVDEQKQKISDNQSHFNDEDEHEQTNVKRNTIEDHTSLTLAHVSVEDTSVPQQKGLNLSEERPLLDYPILGKIVKNLFHGEDKLEWQDIGQMEEQELFDKVIQKLSSGCFPVKPLLESVFSYFIYEKHGTACSLVKNILHSEYNIAVQLSVVRNIYLMEGSDMEKFCSHVFREVERNYAWDNAYSLTMQLENCIDEQYPSLSSKFSVSVSKRSQTIVSVNTLDSIKIKFSVECPMSLIFSKVNMKMYNSVFRFLLKVKWALWALEQLRFKRGELKDNNKAESASNIRKRNMLWLLRFWMLHSVGCLHSYLMGQVLVSLGLELERDTEEAADLDTLIRVHNTYVQKVYTHCLQPKEYENIRRAILELVTLALKLREVWLVGLEIVSEERLSKMGDLYIKCHSQLGAVLQNAVDANHDPLLTHLSDAINSTPPQKKTVDSGGEVIMPACGT